MTGAVAHGARRQPLRPWPGPDARRRPRAGARGRVPAHGRDQGDVTLSAVYGHGIAGAGLDQAGFRRRVPVASAQLPVRVELVARDRLGQAEHGAVSVVGHGAPVRAARRSAPHPGAVGAGPPAGDVPAAGEDGAGAGRRGPGDRVAVLPGVGGAEPEGFGEAVRPVLQQDADVAPGLGTGPVAGALGGAGAGGRAGGAVSVGGRVNRVRAPGAARAVGAARRAVRRAAVTVAAVPRTTCGGRRFTRTPSSRAGRAWAGSRPRRASRAGTGRGTGRRSRRRCAG